MNTKDVISKRKSGGFGWASAMLRSNVDTNGYIKHITNTINLRLFDNNEVLTYAIKSAGFLILIDDQVVVKGTMDFVEHCRSISVTEFERIIISRLLEMGYRFNQADDYYYKAIMKQTVGK
jgi:hypothetical protein